MPIETSTKLPSFRPEGFRPAAKKAFRDFGQRFVSRMKSENLRGQQQGPSVGGGPLSGLHRRSGNLANGLNAALEESSAGFEERAWFSGPGAAYARIQEFGGTVKPTHGRFLWIPLAANLTSAGVQRMTAREAIATGNLFIQWHKGPIAFMRSMVARGAKLTPMFALKRSVELHPRMGGRVLFRTEAANLREDLVAIWKGLAA
jgi:hypothetical protein